MKILVVSDTHGSIDDFIYFVKSLQKPDLIIHLGDYIEDALKIEKILKVDTIKIKGNCDFYSKKVKEQEILDIRGKRILITHGHKYNVKMNNLNIFYKAKQENVDLVLFGHTHAPLNIEKNGIRIVNPGSASIPRNKNERTFAIVEINDKINAKIVQIN